MTPIQAILIGAGNRGADAYAAYALDHPDEIVFVAVAEPRDARRDEFSMLHRIPKERQYRSWEALLTEPAFADVVFVCTPDNQHYAPTMAALQRGYHVVCEKPMSANVGELRAMQEQAERSGRMLSICHVLRYSPFFTKLKSLLNGGVIGQLAAIEHIEEVGYWHMAHSFVRGNWRRQEESSPMILAKCCHNFDILSWLVGSPCIRVSSVGSLMHFRPENRPEGAPDRCLDGCPHRDTCPYYAPRFYLEHPRAKQDGFDRIISMDTSSEGILGALRNGPYGRCVFACDNDVVDHQTTALCYKNGVTASLTMSAFTADCTRRINLMGTRGQLRGNMTDNTVELLDFASGDVTQIHVHTLKGNHSGSDCRMMKDLVEQLSREHPESRTSAAASVESHLAALAAEQSRLAGGRCYDLERGIFL